MPFFTSYRPDHPGTFPGSVDQTFAEGKTEKRIERQQGQTSKESSLICGGKSIPKLTWNRCQRT